MVQFDFASTFPASIGNAPEKQYRAASGEHSPAKSTVAYVSGMNCDPFSTRRRNDLC